MRLEIGLAKKSEHDQDRALVNPKQQLFGVFDGVGAYMDSGLAAQLAAVTVDNAVAEPAKYLSNPPEPILDLLSEIIAECHRSIVDKVIGATTAVVTYIIEDEMYYVSVGDSRVYIKPAGEPIQQLVQDEGEGNILNNWLGYCEYGDYFKGVKQLGSVKIKAGDKIIICTDGITGDWHPDIMTNEELEVALEDNSAQLAAEHLVKTSRKFDDKTAIVIYVRESNAKPR